MSAVNQTTKVQICRKHQQVCRDNTFTGLRKEGLRQYTLEDKLALLPLKLNCSGTTIS